MIFDFNFCYNIDMITIQNSVYIIVGFMLISGVLNWLTFPSDPKEWERIKEEEPKRAGIIQIFRAWGFYPNKFIIGIKMLLGIKTNDKE